MIWSLTINETLKQLTAADLNAEVILVVTERLAHDIVYASATHASPVHEVTDTDSQMQNVSAYGRICSFESLIFNEPEHKLTVILLTVYNFLIHSY